MERKRKYDQNFKEEAVKLASEIGINQAARDLGISHYTLRNWVESKKYRPDNPFIGSGYKYISAQDAEKAALLKENREFHLTVTTKRIQKRLGYLSPREYAALLLNRAEKSILKAA
jgi:transposase